MNYKVLSRKNALLYSQQSHKEKSIIISISGHEENFPELKKNNDNNIKDILYLQFDDISQLEKDKFLLWWKKDENRILDWDALNQTTDNKLILFDSDMASKVVDFITMYSDEIDEIICHCSAGISRSSGCCAAIMKALEGNDDLIFSNNRFHPNMYVYNILLKQFAEAGYSKIWNKAYRD